MLMIIRTPLRPLLKGDDDAQRTHRIILHVDMDAFFALIEQRAHPQWRGKPLIVAGHSMNRGVVCAASYEVRTFGVQSGMALGEARTLCPHAIVVPTDGVKYLDTAHRIFSRLEQYSPQVEVFSYFDGWRGIVSYGLAFLGCVFSLAILCMFISRLFIRKTATPATRG